MLSLIMGVGRPLVDIVYSAVTTSIYETRADKEREVTVFAMKMTTFARLFVCVPFPGK